MYPENTWRNEGIKRSSGEGEFNYDIVDIL
jgi:hypothetical protein